MKRILICLSVALLLGGCTSEYDMPVIPTDPEEPEIPDTLDEPEEPVIPTDTLPFPARYMVARMDISVDGGKEITSKRKEDYLDCTIKIESDTAAWNYEGRGRIRGRGNSTWLWYEKKPYRIKLDEKAEILGLAAEKDWVLLANYRDPTHLMNTFVFEMGAGLGIPYPNHSRYVEVTINGDYKGLYQLTEQVEQGKNRVNIDKKKGWLLSLDVDDGPQESPAADDNFWSKTYFMPVCVKSPEAATEKIRQPGVGFQQVQDKSDCRGDHGRIEESRPE